MFFTSRPPKRQVILALAGLLVLAACAAPPPSDTISDPFETENRNMHAFNLGIDRMLLKPVSGGYDTIPDPVRRGGNNFATNLDLPGDVLNNLLQFRIGKATENSLRFVINSTIGVGGLLDPARAMGVAGKKTDFGETLHVWGVGEGAYVELPLLGPSTQRDALGEVVDIAMNPLGFILTPPESYVPTVATVLSKIDDRGRYSETVDSILYESADGYAQARLLYLQNRRYDLGQAAPEASFEDPYAQ